MVFAGVGGAGKGLPAAAAAFLLSAAAATDYNSCTPAPVSSTPGAEPHCQEGAVPAMRPLVVTTLALAATLVGAVGSRAQDKAAPAALQADPQAVKDYRASRFGMFIHWGVYSQLGRGEWVMNNEKIPI